MHRQMRRSVGLIGGTGIEARGIALRLAAAGVDVTLGSRVRERATEAAGELNRLLGFDKVQGAENGELIEETEILFLTVPFAHSEPVLNEHRRRFSAGQILVDVTVPVAFDKGAQLVELEERSGAEHIQTRIPPELAIVAAFKTLPAHLLAESCAPLDCDEFICSDSPEAKSRVLEVVSRISSLRWIDAGPLRSSRSLEAMTLLAIQINRRYKIKDSRFRLVGLS